MGKPESAQYLETIRASGVAILDAARSEPGAVVPSCPQWTLIDLVTHVGSLHGWIPAILAASGEPDPTPPPKPPVPEHAGTDELLAWAQAKTGELLAAFDGADLGLRCWAFGGSGTGAFWLRRMALETAVHGWDALGAVGGTASLDGDLAADGVDEFLDGILPRRLARNPGGWSGETVHLHRNDGEGEWLVTLGPDGALRTEHSHAKGDLALRGPAESLYLFCLSRTPTSPPERFGDEGIAERWNETLTF